MKATSRISHLCLTTVLLFTAFISSAYNACKRSKPQAEQNNAKAVAGLKRSAPKYLPLGNVEKEAQLLIHGGLLQTGKQLLFDLVRGNLAAKEIAAHGKGMAWAKKELSEAEKSAYLAKTAGNINLDDVVVSITATSLPYKASVNGKQAAIVNFADEKLFYGFPNDCLFVQDEIMIANLFHLALWRMMHSTDGSGGQLPVEKAISAGASTAIFKDVPQYTLPLAVGALYGDNGKFFTSSQQAAQSDAAKEEFKTTLQGIVKRGNIDIHNPPRVNVLAMAAPTGGAKREEVFYLTACCGFSQTEGYVLSGNWGAGVFGNPIGLTAKAQIAAAVATGTQIEVHAFSTESCAEWLKAKAEMQQKISNNPSIKLIELVQ